MRRPPSRPRMFEPLVLGSRLWSWQVVARLSLLGAALVALLWAVDRAWLGAAPPAFDVVVLEQVAAQRRTWLVATARVITHLGDLWVVLLVAASLVLLARRRSGRWDSAWLVVAVVGGVLAVTSVAKHLADRARPDDALVTTLSYAFPSGHASRAAAAYALVAWLTMRWNRRWTVTVAVGVGAAVMTVATGWSRVLLGAHWPSDVLGGWALGLVWVVATLAVVRPEHAEDFDPDDLDVLPEAVIVDEHTVPVDPDLPSPTTRTGRRSAGSATGAQAEPAADEQTGPPERDDPAA